MMQFDSKKTRCRAWKCLQRGDTDLSVLGRFSLSFIIRPTGAFGGEKQKISLKDLGFCILEFGEMKKMHEKAWISSEKSKGTTMVLVASDGLMMRKSQRSKLHSQRW